MELNDLEIYRLSREVSRDVWNIYTSLTWEDRKVMGYQCISATDSIGANIAEGFGRYHYLDKNKFNILKLKRLHIKLNNYIASTRKLNNDK